MSTSSPVTIAVSVPANMLLLGEYAVTQPGRLGVTVAADRRARGTWTPGGETRIEGWTAAPPHRGAPAFSWPGDHGVLGRAAQALRDQLGDPGGCFRFDTSAFFREDGEKRGYGSSAATVVMLAALWNRSVGRKPDHLMQESISLHRQAQGGRGSGYDVAASITGGCARFVGGPIAEAESLTLPWLPPLLLVRGSGPVRTPGALSRFEGWMREQPVAAAHALDRSDALIRAVLDAGGWEEALAHLEAYREWSLELGDAIGVPAAFGLPPGVAGCASWWKAVGAGNELGVAAVARPIDPAALPDGAEPLEIATRGLVWE